MANTPNLGGLVPVQLANGQLYTGSGRAYYSTGGNLGIGDPVIIAGDANPDAIGSSTTGHVLNATGVPAGAYQTVVKATAGSTNKITGVVVGVALDPSTTMAGPPCLPSGQAGVVYVEDDPSVIYSITSDDASGGEHDVGDIGSNANITGSTYNTSTGRSVVKLDSTSVSADATKQLRIVGVSRERNQSDFASPGVTLYVKINLTTETPGVAGV